MTDTFIDSAACLACYLMFQDNMEEINISECQVSEKCWICPVCKKNLSRKQTLRTHLLAVHDIDGKCLMIVISLELRYTLHHISCAPYVFIVNYSLEGNILEKFLTTGIWDGLPVSYKQ